MTVIWSFLSMLVKKKCFGALPALSSNRVLDDEEQNRKILRLALNIVSLEVVALKQLHLLGTSHSTHMGNSFYATYIYLESFANRENMFNHTWVVGCCI